MSSNYANKTQPNMNLDILQRIQKVDPPPFLLTRIQQRIAESYSDAFSRRQSVALAFSFVIVVFVNISVLVYSNSSINSGNYSGNHRSAAATLVQSMNLNSTNELYQ